MSDTDLIGFSGSFTAKEITQITTAVERAEQHFQHQSTNSLMPPWFVVKDDLPGQSRVFIVHRFGNKQAIVTHTLEDLIEQLGAERPD